MACPITGVSRNSIMGQISCTHAPRLSAKRPRNMVVAMHVTRRSRRSDVKQPMEGHIRDWALDRANLGLPISDIKYYKRKEK